jgi:hypothetical protein
VPPPLFDLLVGSAFVDLELSRGLDGPDFALTDVVE